VFSLIIFIICGVTVHGLTIQNNKDEGISNVVDTMAFLESIQNEEDERS
jgi:hypothetical protein